MAGGCFQFDHQFDESEVLLKEMEEFFVLMSLSLFCLVIHGKKLKLWK